MSDFNKIPGDPVIKKTAEKLNKHGFNTIVVENGDEARNKVLEIIPVGAEVMDMTSQTLQNLGIVEAIQKSGRYKSIKNLLMTMDRKTQSMEMQKMGSAHEWAVGSVQAVTQDGHVLAASNTGSQLPAYVYGAAHVIWVVGAQKIVKNTEEGMKRIYDYVLPLESERARKAYGVAGSAVNKLLIINKEFMHGRITLILVKEKLGF
jgi:hypothetical protein